MKTAIERLAESIQYPETVPAGAMSFTFSVDGADIAVRESDGRLIAVRSLWVASGDDEIDAHMPGMLARYAAGRILREEAALAWDDAHNAVILWQDIPTSAPTERFRRFFEVFAASCEWWSDRVQEAMTPEPVFPQMVIRP